VVFEFDTAESSSSRPRSSARRTRPTITSVPSATTFGRSFVVQTPATANLVPPGHYVLFLVSDQGVPSIGEYIHVS
jgi:hypothetical protein